MFTGIVEERGRVAVAGDGHLVVEARTVVRDSDVGASVSVNGVCLTVVERTDTSLRFDLSEQSIERTCLGDLRPGDPVNLERPVTLVARLGGHLVQGHVDGVGEVTRVDADATGGARLSLRVPAELARYVVERGSIAIDGVSLTIAAVDGEEITVALIPHTRAMTTLGLAAPAASRGQLYTMEIGGTGRIWQIGTDGAARQIGGASAYPVVKDSTGHALEAADFSDAYVIARSSRVVFNSPNHVQALALFTDLGFSGEALLEDHIRDRTGHLRDLMVLAHHVGRNWSGMSTLGLAEELGQPTP